MSEIESVEEGSFTRLLEYFKMQKTSWNSNWKEKKGEDIIALGMLN